MKMKRKIKLAFINNIVNKLNPFLGNIYLACCIGVKYDYDITPYFIEYYKDLGVNNFLIILNDSSSNSEKLKVVQQTLRHYNIKEKEIWIGEFSVYEQEKRLTRIKNTYINPEEWM